MGLRSRRGSGFTLIELLVVIVIIALIAALLLPAILKALCSARAGTASHLISQLDQATESYGTDYAVYPSGAGDGSKELVYSLKQNGPKKMRYFEFQQDLLNGGNVVNPVWADGDPPTNIIYYRLNQKQAGSGAPPAGGGGGGNQPPVMRQGRFDMWCAGCDYVAGVSATQWSLNNW